MATLTSLPPEVLTQIMQLIPDDTDSIRPRSSLYPLLRTARSLSSVASTLINQQVTLRSTLQLQHFSETIHEHSSLSDDLTSLEIGPFSACVPTENPSFLLRSLLARNSRSRDQDDRRPNLSDATGVENDFAVKLKFSPSARVVRSTDSDLNLPFSVTRLSLNLEGIHSTTKSSQCAHHTAQSLFSGTTGTEAKADEQNGYEMTQSDGSDQILTPSLLASALGNARLKSLHLSNLRSQDSDLPAATSNGPYSASQLRELKLSYSNISNDSLQNLFDRHGQKLEHLSVIDAQGFSQQNLVDCIKSVGHRLKSLHISDTSQTFATTANYFDAIFGFLPRLEKLSLNGIELSPNTIKALKYTSPCLREITLINIPTTSLQDLLPLVKDAGVQTRLGRIFIEGVKPSEATQTHTLLDLWSCAINKDIELDGATFASIKERMRWASQDFQQEMLPAATRPRKRAGIGMKRA